LAKYYCSRTAGGVFQKDLIKGRRGKPRVNGNAPLEAEDEKRINKAQASGAQTKI
jgi:hypothetical protein